MFELERAVETNVHRAAGRAILGRLSERRKKRETNGSSYKTIDKKFSMQGMFMRFYGLETIHSNDKTMVPRCENLYI